MAKLLEFFCIPWESFYEKEFDFVNALIISWAWVRSAQTIILAGGRRALECTPPHYLWLLAQ